MEKELKEDLPAKERTVLWRTTRLKRYKALDLICCLIVLLIVTPFVVVGGLCGFFARICSIVIESVCAVKGHTQTKIVLKFKWNDIEPKE